MGGGGQLDSSISAKANTALYTTFAVFGFTAGTFLNYIGAKATLAIGGFGYAVFAASYLCYNHTQNQGFVIFAGALLGVCAAFLWCAQGTVMMSYPTEDEKGRYIGLFWGIFNLGAVIGSCSIYAHQTLFITRGLLTFRKSRLATTGIRPTISQSMTVPTSGSLC
jgi:MFS family permease